jgi:hypothetical protein
MSRFYIDDIDEPAEWYGICDENEGGYVAMFMSLADAKEYVERRITEVVTDIPVRYVTLSCPEINIEEE